MKFDIEKFYSANRIEYITKGVNVKTGEVNISCPFCNETTNPDPSFHLGVKLATGEWSCWRNREKHRGRTLHRLLMKVAGISYAEACNLLGEGQIWLEEGAFAALASNPDGIFSVNLGEKEEKILDLPTEFIKFSQNFPSAKPFLTYLRGRGFRNAEKFAKFYDLRYCISGFDSRKWEYRVILPVKLDYELVTWTGRSILRSPKLRYNTLSVEKGENKTEYVAKLPITNVLFNFDSLMEQGSRDQVLVLCEGPFDALKFDYFAKNYGVRATCLFGLSLSDAQLGLMGELCSVFGELRVMLDSAEIDRSLKLTRQLTGLGVKVLEGQLPKGVKDPGDLSTTQIKQLILEWKV